MATPIKDRNLFTATPDPLFSSYLNPVTQQEIDAALGINTPPSQFPVISEVENIDVGPLTYEPSELDLTVDLDKYQTDKYGTLSFSKFEESLSGMSEGELRNLKGQIGGGMFGFAGRQAAEIPASFMEAIDTEIENRASPFERDIDTTLFMPEWHRFGDRFPRTVSNIARTPDRLGRLGKEYFWGEGGGPEDEIQKTLDEMREGWQHKEEKDKYELEQRGLLAESAVVPEDFVGPQPGVPTTEWEDAKIFLKERIIKPTIKQVSKGIGMFGDWLETSPNHPNYIGRVKGDEDLHPDYVEAEAENMIGGDAPLIDSKTGEDLSKNWTTTLGPNDSGLPPALKTKDDEQVKIDENGKALDSLSTRDETGIVTDDQTKTISLTGPGIYESLFEREYHFLRPRPLDRSARRSILFQKIGEQMAATGSVAEGFSKGSAAANQEIRKREMEDVEIRNKAAERARDTYEALLAAQAATGGGLDPTDAKSVVAIQQDYGTSVQAAISAQNSMEMVDAIVGIIENDPRPTHGGYGVVRRMFGMARIALDIEGDTRLNTMVVLQKMLANIDIQTLLAESGKTISDKDRDIAKELLGAKDLFKGAAFQNRKDVLTALDVARSRYDEGRRKALGEVKGMEMMKKQNPSWGQYLYLDPLLLRKDDVLLDVDGQIIDIRRRPKINN